MNSIHADLITSTSLSQEMTKELWTPEARLSAFNQVVLEGYINYYERAIKNRNWSPWHDLPFEEMCERGHQLSEDTAHLIEGFLGVEEHVGDYIQEGVRLFHGNQTRRNMHLQWGAEEARHGATWALVLQHSQVRTAEQLTVYVDRVHSTEWQLQQHPGINTPLGSTIYAMVQERQTFFTYQMVRARVRKEYGLPPGPTLEEQERGYEVGVSEAFRLISQDEIAHHGLFLHIVQSALKYFPAPTCDLLVEVLVNFKMPALRLLPNARVFLRAAKRAGLYSSSMDKEKVYIPLLKSLGLDDHQALENAAQLSHSLPEHWNPEHTVLSRTGEWQITPTQTASGL